MVAAGGRLEFELLTLQTKKLKVRTTEELPCWLRWYRICLQCGRPRFNPWVGKISWRRKWQPTPVFLPGKSHGQRSPVGYRPQGHKESTGLDCLSTLYSHSQGRFLVRRLPGLFCPPCPHREKTLMFAFQRDSSWIRNVPGS